MKWVPKFLQWRRRINIHGTVCEILRNRSAGARTIGQEGCYEVTDDEIVDKRKIISEYNIKATEEIIMAVRDITRSEEGLFLAIVPRGLKEGYKRTYLSRATKETIKGQTDILGVAESIVRRKNDISDYGQEISDSARRVVRTMLLFLSRNDFDGLYDSEMQSVAEAGVRENVRFYLKLLKASGNSYGELVRDGFNAKQYYDSLESISKTNWLVLMRSKDVLREGSFEFRVLQGTVVYIRSMHENEVNRFFAGYAGEVDLR